MVRQGAAYLFVKTEVGTWTQQAKLQATDGVGGGSFGTSVSINQNGSLALIGAPEGNSLQGITFVFAFNGTSWPQQGSLIANDAGLLSAFGYSVSLASEGNYAFVGSPLHYGCQGAWYNNKCLRIQFGDPAHVQKRARSVLFSCVTIVGSVCARNGL